MADDRLERLSRLSGAPAPSSPAPRRGFWETVGDNVIGYDDGVQSFGEDLATWLNMGGESMTVGLAGDEAAAWTAANLMPGGGTYDEELAHYRGNEAQFRESKPALSFMADVGGAVAPGLAWAGAAARGANLATRALYGAAAGGVGGATQGFMEGEGGPANRVENAVLPAILGAGLGAAMPAVAQGSGALYRALGPGAAAALRRLESQMGIRGGATDLVSRAVEQDAPFAGARVAAAGPDAVNAQMGPNSTGLLNYVAAQPGTSSRVRSQVNDFAEGQRANFERTMDETMGVPEGVARRQREMMQNTAQARQEAYAAAYARPIDYASDAGRRLESMLGQLDASDLKRAERLARREGAPSQQRLYRVDEEGNVTWERLPDVRELDYLTRSLQEVGYANGSGPAEARIARGLARDIRKTIDEIVPEYQAARAAGQDPILNREAMEFGQKLLRDEMKMDVVEDRLADMTQVERQFAARAVRDEIAEMTANANAVLSDPAADVGSILRPLRDITNAAGQRKLRALLGADADKVIAQAKAAYQALGLRSNIAVGSATQPRQAWQAEVDALVPRGPMEALQQDGVTAAIGTALNSLAGDPAAARLARQSGLLDAVGTLLMQPMRQAGNSLPAVQMLPGLLGQANLNARYVADDVTRLGGLLNAYATGATSR